MAVKDYYAMLQVPPGATPLQIKKSFRKLAQRYHPDKQPNNPEAAAWYSELHTAYLTLTTPHLLKEYLQQRWLYKANGRKLRNEGSFDVAYILARGSELQQQAARLNRYQLDYSAWLLRILSTVDEETTQHMEAYATPGQRLQLAQHAIDAANVLPFGLQQKVLARLHLLLKQDDASQELLAKTLARWRRRWRWQHQQVWLLVGVALAICLLLYLLVMADVKQPI